MCIRDRGELTEPQAGAETNLLVLSDTRDDNQDALLVSHDGLLSQGSSGDLRRPVCVAWSRAWRATLLSNHRNWSCSPSSSAPRPARSARAICASNCWNSVSYTHLRAH